MCSRNPKSNGHSNIVNEIRLNKPSKNLMSTTEKSTTHRCADKRFKCDTCDYSSHFASELEVHKIVHRTNPLHQCMHVNCGKWFLEKVGFESTFTET